MDHNYYLSKFNNWIRMRDEKFLLDGILTSEDGKEFPVHRALFAATSDFFRAGFTPPLGGEKIRLDCSSKIVQIIVDFTYEEDALFSKDISTLKQLLIAADMYCITNLHKFCTTALMNCLDATNCIELHYYGCTYNSGYLRDAAHHYALKHFEQVMTQNNELYQLPFNQLFSYLCSDLLNIRSEHVISDIVKKWIDVNPSDREKMKTQLLATRRLPTREYGIDNLWPRFPYQSIIILGGFAKEFIGGAMETLDPRADTWLSWGDLSVTHRAYHGIAELDGIVYLIGGFNGTTFLSSVEMLDINFLTWQKASHMLVPRCYVSVVVLDGYIYAIGGHSGYGMRLRSCERYDPDKNQWDWINCMHSMRSDAAACAFNSKIYVAGGYDGVNVLDTVEVYDPYVDHWQMITEMPSPRSGLQMLPVKGRIYILGGFDGTNRLAKVHSILPEEEQTWHDEERMRLRRSNFSAVYFEDHIWVMGGFNDDLGTLSRTEKLGRNGWVSGPPLNSEHSCPAATVLGHIPNPYLYSLKHNILNCDEGSY